MGLAAAVLECVVNNLHYITVALAACFVLRYLLRQCFSRDKAKNPFEGYSNAPATPLVTDEAERKKVIKQGFARSKVDGISFDAIVIGSGMGGLTAAVVMARAGKRVLVLEQHGKAGGCCHTFVKKGFEFDVGLHYIGEVSSQTLTKTCFDVLTDGQLQWASMDTSYDTVVIDRDGTKKLTVPMSCGAKQLRQVLMEHFPKEHKAIDKFFELLKDARKSFMGFFLLKALPVWVSRLLLATKVFDLISSYRKYSSQTTMQVLDKITNNADLKAVLSYCYGDYGVTPKNACFTLQALLISHYMREGASYPVGGASEIIFHMIPIVERAGGRVLVRALVERILFDDAGRVCGVRLSKDSEEPVDVLAPLVISNAGVRNTLEKLVPPHIASTSSIYPLLKDGRLSSSCGCMSIFVGLNGTKKSLSLPAGNTWLFPSNDLSTDFETYQRMTAPEAADSDPPVLFIGFPSAKDPSYEARYPGKSTCIIITFLSWDWFAEFSEDPVKKRGTSYEALKAAFAKRAWDRCLRLFPQLESKVEYFQVGTPATNNHYLNTVVGETYGLAHDMARMSAEVALLLRPDIGIPGLLLTGQDVMTCGVTSAAYAGLLCASAALERNVMYDLLGTHKVLAAKCKNA